MQLPCLALKYSAFCETKKRQNHKSMEDNKITREVYKQYANKIVSVLGNESFYEQFKKRVDKGSSVFKLAKNA